MSSSDVAGLLGIRIRARRHELGLSQATIAHRCGTHGNYIGMVERGERNITIVVLVRIARALEVPVEQLVAGLADGPRNRG